jgi:signal transduction histidine kinase
MRRPRNLFRSSPVRLALGLVALFAVVSLASLAASYAATRASLDTAMRSDLTQDVAGFRAAPSATAVAALVAAQARVTDPNRLVLSYLAPNGRQYGNGVLKQDAEGYFITTLDDEGPALDGDYLAFTTRLYGGQLSIARSRAEIDQLWRVFRNILLLSLLPTLAIALAVGLMMARRSGRQVDLIGATLDRLTSGDLAARVRPHANWSDDLGRIGQRVDRMATAQEQSVTALRQVSSDVAHDLKTPMQRIAVRLDDLRTRDLPDDTADLVDLACADIDSVVSVFHALLQISQIEAGTPKSRFTAVDLMPLVQTFAELYEPTVTQEGRQLHLRIEPSNAFVRGDADLLGQILANLIENALRHTPKGSDITVRLRTEQSSHILSISDAGPGISVLEREKVLQRLYRLDRSRTTPGSGLGLSLVSVISDLHDASVTLSDNNPGLTVAIRFDALNAP